MLSMKPVASGFRTATVRLATPSDFRQDLWPGRGKVPVMIFQSPAPRVQSPISKVKSPASRVQSSASRVQSSASRVQGPVSKAQSLVTRVQSPISTAAEPILSKQKSTAPSIAASRHASTAPGAEPGLTRFALLESPVGELLATVDAAGRLTRLNFPDHLRTPRPPSGSATSAPSRGCAASSTPTSPPSSRLRARARPQRDPIPAAGLERPARDPLRRHRLLRGDRPRRRPARGRAGRRRRQ